MKTTPAPAPGNVRAPASTPPRDGGNTDSGGGGDGGGGDLDADDYCNKDALFFDNPDEIVVKNFMGLVAVVAFIVLALAALNLIRRKYYKLFYRIHIICTVVAFVSLYYHHAAGTVDVCVIYIFLILFDYAARFFRVWRRRASIVASKEARDENGNVIAVTISAQCNRAGNVLTSESLAGGYFFICCPAVSRVQWHPMSVVGVDVGMGNIATLRFSIKGLGAWSKQLVDMAPLLADSRRSLLIDGPFGRWSVQPSEYSHVVVFCGGIGVTPFLQLLGELCSQQAEQDGKYMKQAPHVWFIWALREPGLYRHFERTLQEAVGVVENRARIRVHLTCSNGLPRERGANDGAAARLQLAAEGKLTVQGGRPDM